MSPSDQDVQGRLRSLSRNLNRSIRLVSDGPGQSEIPRFSLGAFPEKNPLNTAVNDDGDALYHGHKALLNQNAERRTQKIVCHTDLVVKKF